MFSSVAPACCNKQGAHARRVQGLESLSKHDGATRCFYAYFFLDVLMCIWLFEFAGKAAFEELVEELVWKKLGFRLDIDCIH